jgi:plasmid maintenance system antidote protein VapI
MREAGLVAVVSTFFHTFLEGTKFFGNSNKFWLNLQNELDVRQASKKMEAVLEAIKPYG